MRTFHHILELTHTVLDIIPPNPDLYHSNLFIAYGDPALPFTTADMVFPDAQTWCNRFL